MRKTILIGSMLVLTLLLMMPSIPAIQQKKIEYNAYSDFIEKIKNDIKYPNLYELLSFLIDFRCTRGFVMALISTDFWGNVENFYFYYRGMWLYITAVIFAELGDDIIDKLGWGWDSLKPWYL
ncbi:MAG: hypothetical protein JSW60_08745 [Thermoplasmatales archaeon]|nr:MAG: hypothetical protein JSW60_08745 [Thermoplasmatales archaeon]